MIRADYATRVQPAPELNEGESVIDWLVKKTEGVENEPVAKRVSADLNARRELGRAIYGDELRTQNGRDALVDAYQNLLDAASYLAQAFLEQEPFTFEPLTWTVAMCIRIREVMEARDAVVEAVESAGGAR